MKLKVIMPTFFWFKHTCVMSWVIIVLSTVTACLNIAALTSCDDIRDQICDDVFYKMELESYKSNCSSAFQKLSDCNVACEMVHSTCMRNCFLLASTDGTADVAYALASYYENFTFNPEVQDAERTLMADLNFRRRRLGAPEAASATADAPLRLGGRSLFPSLEAAQAAAAAAQAERSPERVAGRREAAQERAARWLRVLREDAAADASRRRGKEEDRPPEAQTDEAYLAVAVATSISLVGAGALHVLYGTLIMWSLLNIFPAAATLHALGGGCCRVPDEPTVMYKRQMRCACHFGWLLGTGLLLSCSLYITKYQVLMRYLSNVDERFSSDEEGKRVEFSSNQVPERFGYESAVLCLVPCIFGACAGLLPTFNAMLISRSRAERRAAMMTSTLRQVSSSDRKYLTGPVRVDMSPSPNPATAHDDGDGLLEERV